jgi:hypothetical protein
MYEEDVEASKNREMIQAGAALCIVVHRLLAASLSTRDCDRLAITVGIPTSAVDFGVPGRLKAGGESPS